MRKHHHHDEHDKLHLNDGTTLRNHVNIVYYHDLIEHDHDEHHHHNGAAALHHNHPFDNEFHGHDVYVYDDDHDINPSVEHYGPADHIHPPS